MTRDVDVQFLCKDCERYNLCEYYHRRKKDSYICKYFHLSEIYGMTNNQEAESGVRNECKAESKKSEKENKCS